MRSLREGSPSEMPRGLGEAQLVSTFERTVDLGVARLSRTWPGLLSTGLVGAVDVSAGVLAMLVVQEATGNPLLGALAFGVGFVALTLANSELFTENFLVPLAAVAAQKSTTVSLLRLWGGTLVANLVGGWVMMALIVTAIPRLSVTANELAGHYVALGLNGRAMAGALLGGAFMTLLTWMDRATESVPAKLLAAVSIAFLLIAGPLNHVVVSSFEMFAALIGGASFGYADWAAATAWYGLGNVVGGLGLVTGLRLVQVGQAKIAEERERPLGAARHPQEPSTSQ